MAEAPPRCPICGLMIQTSDDRTLVHGRSFHPACVSDRPPLEHDGRHRSMLGRIAHWANALGWGQST